MSSLNKSQILGANDIVREPVDVPEWGGVVYVRVMSARERDRFEQRFIEDRYNNIRAFLAVATVCDEEGRRLFEDYEVGDLGDKSSAALDRIFLVACRINKLSKEDVEDLEGNSAASHSGGSSSASRILSA